jgi:hypothetical protein
MKNYARLARDAGARIIGGCCGSTPEHIAALVEALRDHKRRERPTLEIIEGELGLSRVAPRQDGETRTRRSRRHA